MSKWIDADALKKSIDDCDICNICPDKDVRCDYDCGFPDCLTPKWETLIDHQPSIDIVRCQDCRYRYMDADLQVWTCTYGLMIKPDGFCNYGERKESDDA